ncbi:hypothetical protein ACFSJY_04020 [Thalassotalea euphylliae]|uniref:hypothetical protein n=1 Tax=Thalassotalea euphylliae TaxID=1655234 RepID=UPI00362BE405
MKKRELTEVLLHILDKGKLHIPDITNAGTLKWIIEGEIEIPKDAIELVTTIDADYPAQVREQSEYSKALHLLSEAEKYGLINVISEDIYTHKKPDENRIFRLAGKLATLNESGFSAALKFQEFNDNERRFQQQKDFTEEQINISESQANISAALKTNSDKSIQTARIALGITAFALILSGFRVYQLEQKIISNQEMDRRIKLLEIDNRVLKNELSNIKKQKSGVPANQL